MMADLFKYNPTPWSHARCGDNWDINLPSETDANGVGVVATCFAGEDIARLIAAAPALYAVADEFLSSLEMLERHGPDLTADGEEFVNAVTLTDRAEMMRAALKQARGEQ